MDIRNNLESLKTILGVSQTTAATTAQPRTSVQTGASAGISGDQAVFSSAGSAVSQAATDSSVRLDKVAQIQAQLAAGTYHVSASAVASKLVDSMLGN